MQYQSTLYQVQAKERTRRLRHAEVTVCEALDGTLTLLRQGERLPYTTYCKGERASPLEDAKTVNQRVDQALRTQAQRRALKPAPDHPWRQYPRAIASATQPTSRSHGVQGASIGALRTPP